MCKILVVPGIKKENIKNAKRFMQRMGKEMSFANKDGLGYAAIDSSGNLFGERWLDNDTAFTGQTVQEGGDEGIIIDIFDKVLKTKALAKSEKPIEMNSFGTVNLDDMVAFTLHTRYATAPKGMGNTHPFVKGDTSLIHNGVIRNDKDFKCESTCDSEAILLSYLDHKVGNSLEHAAKMADSLVGYYACGVFSRDASGTRILDVFKANNNSLHVSYIKQLGTFVMTSSEYDIKKVCEEFGWKFSTAMDFKDGILMRFNPFTGEMIGVKDFSPSKEFSYQNFPTRGNTGTNTAPHKTTQQGPNSWDGATILEWHGNKAASKRRNISREEVAFYAHKPGLIEMDEHEVFDYLKTINAD